MPEITMPELGENITKATISFWYVKEGERVEKEQEIVEACTDKATFNVPSPYEGVITKILINDGEAANVGQAIAIIE